jgi:hypothetical protein
MNAPNPYHLLAMNNIYDERLVLFGVIFTLIVVLSYLFIRLRKEKYLDKTFWIYDLSLLSTLIPFILPKMHERYFFTAALFLLLLGFLDNKMLIPAILIQISSILSYLNYFIYSPVDLTLIAFYINIPIVGWMIGRYILVIQSRQKAFQRLETPGIS